jgi:hypothetical protein
MNAIRNLAQASVRRGLVSVSHPPAMGLVQTQQQQHNNIQTRFISKYISKSMKKRIPLTTKRAGKGYYKGKGATKEGRLTSKGRFIPDRKKMLELVVPDLEGFNVSVVYSTVLCLDGEAEAERNVLCLLVDWSLRAVFRPSEGTKGPYIHTYIITSLNFCVFLVCVPFSTKQQLKPYIARVASKIEPELRRRPGQV